MRVVKSKAFLGVWIKMSKIYGWVISTDTQERGERGTPPPTMAKYIGSPDDGHMPLYYSHTTSDERPATTDERRATIQERRATMGVWGWGNTSDSVDRTWSGGAGNCTSGDGRLALGLGAIRKYPI